MTEVYVAVHTLHVSVDGEVTEVAAGSFVSPSEEDTATFLAVEAIREPTEVELLQYQQIEAAKAAKVETADEAPKQKKTGGRQAAAQAPAEPETPATGEPTGEAGQTEAPANPDVGDL